MYRDRCTKKRLTLGRLLHDYPDELRADFQQYYSLNLDGLGIVYSVNHAAILCEQLPQKSRTYLAINNENIWDDQALLLSRIEHNTRILAWQNTRDGQKNRRQPKPLYEHAQKNRKQPKLLSLDVNEFETKRRSFFTS